MKNSTDIQAARKDKPNARAGAQLYQIHLPGVGMFGSYPTVEAAQTALYYLPISARKRATICRSGGRSA